MTGGGEKMKGGSSKEGKPRDCGKKTNVLGDERLHEKIFPSNAI